MKLEEYHCEPELCKIARNRTCKDCANKETCKKRKSGRNRKCFICKQDESCDKKVMKIMAKRCRVCGGLITTMDAIKAGIGECCARREKEALAAAEAEKNQFSIYDYIQEEPK